MFEFVKYPIINSKTKRPYPTIVLCYKFIKYTFILAFYLLYVHYVSYSSLSSSINYFTLSLTAKMRISNSLHFYLISTHYYFLNVKRQKNPKLKTIRQFFRYEAALRSMQTEFIYIQANQVIRLSYNIIFQKHNKLLCKVHTPMVQYYYRNYTIFGCRT